MKSKYFRFLVAAFALLVGVAMSQAQDAATDMPMHHFGHGDHMMGFMAHELNLTDAQKAQMKETLKGAHTTMKPLMEQLHQIHQQLGQYVTGTYDDAKVRTLAAQEAQLQAEMTVQHTKIHNQLFQMLTPEQQTKAKELMAQHEARMAEHMQHMHDTPAPPEQ